MDLEKKIDDIILREGTKFTNRKNDKGGPTKFGITQETLSRWLGRQAGVEEVEALSEETARDIYRKEFLRESPFWGFPDPLYTFLADWSITSGFDDPTFAVQRMLNDFGFGLKVDGVCGGKTRQALERFITQHPMKSILDRLIDARALFYAGLVRKDPTQAENIVGWLNRTFGFRNY